MKIRLDGDWEGWLKFFLKGIKEVSEEAANSASKIIVLKETILKKLFDKNQIPADEKRKFQPELK